MAKNASSTKSRGEKVADTTAAVVQRMIEIIEAGTDGSGWRQMWRSLARPGAARNARTGNRYTGGNYIALAVAEMSGAAVGPWATFKQWQELGASVKKGSKGTALLKPVPYEKDRKNKAGEFVVDPKTGEIKKDRGVLFMVFYVFSSDQVEGWTKVAPAALPESVDQLDATAQAWLDAVVTAGPVRVVEGEPAFWPGADVVSMPMPILFATPGSYFATFAHELAHWTGAKARLGRDLAGRFGDAKYAAEELVAELASALKCADLGIEGEAHENHAEYLAHWLGALKEDPSRLWTAGSAAEAAVKFLDGLAGAAEVETETEEVTA